MKWERKKDKRRKREKKREQKQDYLTGKTDTMCGEEAKLKPTMRVRMIGTTIDNKRKDEGKSIPTLFH